MGTQWWVGETGEGHKTHQTQDTRHKTRAVFSPGGVGVGVFLRREMRTCMGVFGREVGRRVGVGEIRGFSWGLEDGCSDWRKWTVITG